MIDSIPVREDLSVGIQDVTLLLLGLEEAC